MTTQVDYWNHNVHYQPVILNAVPDGCGAALEVGCGDGMLARRLAGRAAEVTAIDRDAEMIALARKRTSAAEGTSGWRVRYVHADFLACPVEAASYDFACANTVLHHMDFAAALASHGPRAAAGRAPRGGRPGGERVARRLPDRRAGRARQHGSTVPSAATAGPVPPSGPGDDLGRGPCDRPGCAPGRALPPASAVALLATLAQARRIAPARRGTAYAAQSPTPRDQRSRICPGAANAGDRH